MAGLDGGMAKPSINTTDSMVRTASGIGGSLVTGAPYSQSSSSSSLVNMTNSTTMALSQTKPPIGQSSSANHTTESRMLDRRRLADLVKEVDPLEQLDDDVEELLLQIADDFIDNVVTASCQIAKHRKSNTVEVKDVQLHLEHNWNMWMPGFGSDEVRPYKKSAPTEAHKQRIALIKKVQKKL